MSDQKIDTDAELLRDPKRYNPELLRLACKAWGEHDRISQVDGFMGFVRTEDGDTLLHINHTRSKFGMLVLLRCLAGESDQKDEQIAKLSAQAWAADKRAIAAERERDSSRRERDQLRVELADTKLRADLLETELANCHARLKGTLALADEHATERARAELKVMNLRADLETARAELKYGPAQTGAGAALNAAATVAPPVTRTDGAVVHPSPAAALEERVTALEMTLRRFLADASDGDGLREAAWSALLSWGRST